MEIDRHELIILFVFMFLCAKAVNVDQFKAQKIKKTYILDEKKSFSDQIKFSSTRYIIKDSFNLFTKTIVIPPDCALEFNGGCLCNGTIVGQGTSLSAGPLYIFKNTVLTGSFTTPLNALWFGLSPENRDNYIYLKNALSSSSNNRLYIPTGIYEFKKTIDVYILNSRIIGDSYRGTTSTLLKFNPDFYSDDSDHTCFIEAKAFDLTIENIGFLTNSKGNNYIAVELIDSVRTGQIDSNVKNCYISGFERCVVAHGRGIRVENNLFSNTHCCLNYLPAHDQSSVDIAQNPPYDGRGVIFVNNKCHGIDKKNNTLNGSAVVIGEGSSCRQGKSSILAMMICNNEIDNTGSLVNSFLPISDSVISGNILAKSISTCISCINGINGLLITNNIVGKYIATTSATCNVIILLSSPANEIKNVIIEGNILKDCLGEAISINGENSNRLISVENISICNNIFDNVKKFFCLKKCSYDKIQIVNNIYPLFEEYQSYSIENSKGKNIVVQKK